MREAGEELHQLLNYWQKRLRLQDWDVRLCYVQRHEAEREDAMAYVEVFLPKRSARICFIEPGELDPAGWPQEAPEQSLVHELLHLHVHPFSPKADTPAWTAMEQAVHAIAAALVEPERVREATGDNSSTERGGRDAAILAHARTDRRGDRAGGHDSF